MTTRWPPPALLALIYAGWILTGTLLLKLPAASVAAVSWSDALFTATSAVTVTGLVVADPGSVFSGFGQAVIALLIQLGGMGLMTFAVLVLSGMGLRISLAQRRFTGEELGLQSVGGILELAWIIFRVVVFFELVGAAILCIEFVPEFGWQRGVWFGLFHSISAFNNAGFSLFPDSLASYVDAPVVLFTTSVQFIVGGLGFAVLSDVLVLRRWQRYSLHSKLMLIGSAALIVGSVCAYALLEWHNPATLGGLDTTVARLQAAWFEAVTTRTAGFNTLNTAAVNDSTTMMTMVLMMIGGGPTSTAGGLKVTTLLVLLMATIAFFRKSGQIHAFGFSVGAGQSLKVMALLTVSLFVVITGIFVLLATQQGNFLDLAFETVSAYATVGLSRGATSELDAIGRGVIIAIMFIGRLGPLTLGFFLASKVVSRVKYPEGDVYLG